MCRLDRYFLREALVPLVFGLFIYSSLAVISVTIPRLQWIVGTPIRGLSSWLLLQFPTALVQTLPIALVLSVLLAFGRLAANNELQAVQAGGISLARSTRVFIFIGLVLAAAALYTNETILPKTNAKVGSLYWELTSGGGSGLWRLAAKNIPLDGYTLYFDTYDRKTDELLKVRVEAWNQKSLTVLFAERAVFTDEGLLLYNYQTDLIDFQALNTDYAEAEGLLADLIKRHSSASSPEQSILLTTSDSYEDLITRFSEGGFEDSRSIREAYADANDASLSERDRKQSAVLFHRKLAEPLANLSLLLIAVPLSLLYAGSRSVAFGLSLVVTLAWYLLFTLGQLFAQAGTVPVWLGVWAANILLAAVGVYLLMVPSRLR